MISRDAVVAAAREWLGTPYRHQSSLKGIGADCLGLVRGVSRELWNVDPVTADYGELPDPDAMGRGLREHLDPVALADIQPGDILWLRVAIDPQHLAIVTETEPRLMMIHALRRSGTDSRVVEHGVDQIWRDRIVGCFRYRGVG